MQQQPLIAQSLHLHSRMIRIHILVPLKSRKHLPLIASFTVVFKSSNSSDVGDRLSVCEPVSLWYYIPLNRSYSCQYYTYFAYPGDLSSEKGPLHRDSYHQSNSLFDSTLTDGRSHDAFYMSIHINKTGRNDITRASIF